MAISISLYGYKKAFTILLIMISVLIIAIIGVANTVHYNISTIINPNLHYESNNNYQCSHAFHVKMFDSEIAPKYIIGKGYKIIPVNPVITDVLVNRCTLAPVDISQ